MKLAPEWKWAKFENHWPYCTYHAHFNCSRHAITQNIQLSNGGKTIYANSVLYLYYIEGYELICIATEVN